LQIILKSESCASLVQRRSGLALNKSTN